MRLRFYSALLLLGLATTCRATDFKSVDTYLLAPGQSLSNELWLQARTITFSGEALDDCFLLAESVGQATITNLTTARLSGKFREDLWALGETVEMSGDVAHHARLAALKTLTVSGTVGHNVIALSPTIILTTNVTVGGSAILAGQDIIINGRISGDTRAYGTGVTLSGQFDGNVWITAGDINVMPGTRIGGNLIYRMDRDLVLDSRVDLGGKIIKADLVTPKESAPSTTSALLLQLGLFCGALMTGLIFVSLMPGIVALSVHKLSESPWRCILYGFITFSLLPMTSFFLLFTLVGIPLSVTLFMANLIMIYVSKIITGLYVGHLILRRKTPIPPGLLFPVMALGLLMLYAATSFPFPLGAIAWFMVTLAGMGALVGAMLDRRIPVLINYPPDQRAKPPPLPGALPPGAV